MWDRCFLSRIRGYKGCAGALNTLRNTVVHYQDSLQFWHTCVPRGGCALIRLEGQPKNKMILDTAHWTTKMCPCPKSQRMASKIVLLAWLDKWAQVARILHFYVCTLWCHHRHFNGDIIVTKLVSLPEPPGESLIYIYKFSLTVDHWE